MTASSEPYGFSSRDSFAVHSELAVSAPAQQRHDKRRAICSKNATVTVTTSDDWVFFC